MRHSRDAGSAAGRFLLGLVFCLGCPAPAPAYIAVNAERLTLCEVMLEFPRVAELELEKSDPAKGAYVFRVAETLSGRPTEEPIRFALLQDGKLPERLAGLRPRERVVAFFGSPDQRSLIFCRGGWLITRPDQGWERFLQFRDDFAALFWGEPGELAAAVRTVARGGAVTVRILPKGVAESSRMFVRYDAATPHSRVPVADPDDRRVLNFAELESELSNRDPARRRQAVLRLAVAEASADPQPVLIAALRDPHVEVRLAAAAGLSQRKSLTRETLKGLEHALKDDDRFVCTFAARALGAAGREAEFAVASLTAALADRNFDHDFRPHRAAEAAHALLRIAPETPAAERAIRLLLSDRMLNDHRVDSEGTRAAAARTLGRAGAAARSTVPELLKRLDDELPAARIAAAEAIFLVGGESAAQSAARKIIQREMETGAIGDRVQAIRAAAATSDPSLVSLVQGYADNPNDDIRRAAGEALRKRADSNGR